MKKNISILLLLTFLIILMFINSKEVVLITKNNIDFAINSFIPSLLPYIIILSLMCELGLLEILGYILQFIFIPLFSIRGKTSALMIAGLISGYPLPSLLVSNKDKINKEEQDVISIFVFPSLAFLINQISPNLNNEFQFKRLIISFYLGAFILLFFKRIRIKEKVEYIHISTLKNDLNFKYKNINISKLLKKVIINSLINMSIIVSNILIFSLISFYLSKLTPLESDLTWLLEFSRSSSKIVPNGSYFKYLQLIIILLWGGVSVFMQNSALLAHTNFSLKIYILNRILLIISVIVVDLLIFF